MDLRLFTGRSNPHLAQGISRYLGIEIGHIEVSDFSDGEIFVQIQEKYSWAGCIFSAVYLSSRQSASDGAAHHG